MSLAQAQVTLIARLIFANQCIIRQSVGTQTFVHCSTTRFRLARRLPPVHFVPYQIQPPHPIIRLGDGFGRVQADSDLQHLDPPRFVPQDPTPVPPSIAQDLSFFPIRLGTLEDLGGSTRAINKIRRRKRRVELVGDHGSRVHRRRRRSCGLGQGRDYCARSKGTRKRLERVAVVASGLGVLV